ncbi:MAG: hypothetical protein J5640_01605 [Bacteroidales bacterium]|nr:hypothetical protein [Bacteroidales bacterium]
MLKKLSLSAFVCFVGVALFAQAKIKEVVTSDYNRNSVTMIVIQRGDSYDSATASAVRKFTPSSKFDLNNIKTRSVKVNKLRSEPVTQTEADAAVGKVGFAREILAAIFNRDSKGMMDDKTVRYRGNYDAKDQDVINARAARVGEDALGDLGQKLVAGSYIVATDFYKVDRQTDKKGNVYWSVNARAFAYQIGLGEDGLSEFYEKCWIYEDDNQATRDAKIKAFQALDIPMVPVASASTASTSSSVEAAAGDCLSGLITGLENRIANWEVAVAISARKPLRAKIGTKEGLSNGARYRAYSYSEDSHGNLKSVARGYLRATEIANNSGMSAGDTEPSEFYQISGIANIDEGWTIKQSNDLGLGVMLGVGGGIFNSLRLNADYLVRTKTNGQMSYILADLTMDLGKGSSASSIYMALGYAYGLHLTRFFEIAPYLMLGDDYMSASSYSSGSDLEDTARFLRRSGFVLEPGMRATVNLAYPLQAYARMYYDILMYNSLSVSYDSYSYYNDRAPSPMNHHSGFGVQFGLKWTF